MSKKEVKSYLEELEKKHSNVSEINYGALLLAGVGAGATIVSGMIGGMGAISAEIGYHALETQVVDSESFEAMNIERRNAIIDDLTSGKISHEEYQSRLDALYSREAVIDYAKNSGNTTLAQTANAYKKSKDMGDVVLGTGAPMMAGFFGVGLAEFGITEYIRRKYERKILAYKAQMAEAEKGL